MEKGKVSLEKQKKLASDVSCLKASAPILWNYFHLACAFLLKLKIYSCFNFDVVIEKQPSHKIELYTWLIHSAPTMIIYTQRLRGKWIWIEFVLTFDPVPLLLSHWRKKSKTNSKSYKNWTENFPWEEKRDDFFQGNIFLIQSRKKDVWHENKTEKYVKIAKSIHM